MLYSDRTLEYRSTDELLKARNEIRMSLTNAAGPRPCEVRLIKD
ncbi:MULTISPECIES: phage head-tail joining protein [Pseudomonas]